jgi:hypothetical protein
MTKPVHGACIEAAAMPTEPVTSAASAAVQKPSGEMAVALLTAPARASSKATAPA